MRGAGIRPQIVTSLTFRNAGELREIVAFATRLDASRIRIDSIGSLVRHDRRSQPGTGLSAFEILQAGEDPSHRRTGRPGFDKHEAGDA